jgi:hypothetical protein
VLFLTSHCDGCGPFWRLPLAREDCGLDPQVAAVVVARDPRDEEPDALAALTGVEPASASGFLVMSGTAWRTYRVHGPPFFVLVDGVTVATEGVAWSVEQVVSDVARARRRAAGDAGGGARVPC